MNQHDLPFNFVDTTLFSMAIGVVVLIVVLMIARIMDWLVMGQAAPSDRVLMDIFRFVGPSNYLMRPLAKSTST